MTYPLKILVKSFCFIGLVKDGMKIRVGHAYPIGVFGGITKWPIKVSIIPPDRGGG